MLYVGGGAGMDGPLGIYHSGMGDILLMGWFFGGGIGGLAGDVVGFVGLVVVSFVSGFFSHFLAFSAAILKKAGVHPAASLSGMGITMPLVMHNITFF